MPSLSTFIPVGGTTIAASPASIAAPLPSGGASTVLITNFGENTAFVQMGGSGVIASQGGVPILPKTSIALAGGTNTFLAAITLAGSTGISVVSGT